MIEILNVENGIVKFKFDSGNSLTAEWQCDYRYTPEEKAEYSYKGADSYVKLSNFILRDLIAYDISDNDEVSVYNDVCDKVKDAHRHLLLAYYDYDKKFKKDLNVDILIEIESEEW